MDRRGPNGGEAKWPSGSTSRLPTGARLCELTAPRYRGVALVSSTDRKDMYYQVKASAERASTNALGPPVSVAHLSDPIFDDAKADLA